MCVDTLVSIGKTQMLEDISFDCFVSTHIFFEGFGETEIERVYQKYNHESLLE